MATTTKTTPQQRQDLHFWAHCPYCDQNVHTACFPLIAEIEIGVIWEEGEVAGRIEIDTQPIRNHMEKLHPDKVGLT